jgi:hypothetical protein
MTTVIEANTANKPARRTLLADLPGGVAVIGDSEGNVRLYDIVSELATGYGEVLASDYAALRHAITTPIMPQTWDGDGYAIRYFHVAGREVKAMCVLGTGDWFVCQPTEKE